MPSKTTAADIMRRKLVTFTEETTVMDAVAALLKHKISGAPVLDAGGRLLGLVSELDCTTHLVHALTHNEPTGFTSEVMTSDVKTVPPDATLLTLAHHFNQLRVKRLPVVDGEHRLMGQVSRVDLMQKLYEIAKPKARAKAKPLYLSAVRGSDELPAKLDPDSRW